jgi:hypothetical protein
MVFAFLAYVPQDQALAEKLSTDFRAQGVEHWLSPNNGDELSTYQHLQKSSHLIAILSPGALADVAFLGALEFAKQNKLERIALRAQAIEALPPQLSGVLPLDFSSPEAYSEGLETLLEDLKIAPPPPAPELPPALFEGLHSPLAEERREAIEALAQYRNAEGPLRDLALDELNALVFRERESGVKALLLATVYSFDRDKREAEPSPTILSQEELEAETARKAQAGHESLVFDTSPLRMQSDESRPSTPQKQYLWKSPRWYVILFGLSGFFGLALSLLSGQPAYFIPSLIVGGSLAYFNVAIRQGGDFHWKPANALIGNLILGGGLAGFLGLLLIFPLGLGGGFVLGAFLLGLILGALIGWLSSLEL